MIRGESDSNSVNLFRGSDSHKMQGQAPPLSGEPIPINEAIREGWEDKALKNDSQIILTFGQLAGLTKPYQCQECCDFSLTGRL